jgi:hypothetical protein
MLKIYNKAGPYWLTKTKNKLVFFVFGYGKNLLGLYSATPKKGHSQERLSQK